MTPHPAAVLLVALSVGLAACAPHVPTKDRMVPERNGPDRPKPAPTAPARWFPEAPGLYTRTLPDGQTQVTIVEAPRGYKAKTEGKP